MNPSSSSPNGLTPVPADLGTFGSLATSPNGDKSIPFAYPLSQQVSPSSSFGLRVNPFQHDLEHHEGIDFPSEKGSPIYAAAAGKVMEAGYDRGYGNQVTIDHGNGYVTKYAHAGQLLVRVGDRVEQSQTIALVGSTGKSTGPHLHYEVSYQNRPINPQYLLTHTIRNNYLPKQIAWSNNIEHQLNWAKKLNDLDQRQQGRFGSYVQKPFYAPGDMVAVVRVRSGKLVQ